MFIKKRTTFHISLFLPIQIYGGSFNFFSNDLSSIGIELTYAPSNSSVDIVRACNPRTKLVWLETCSNPLLNMTDLKDVADTVHKYNRDIIVAIDNTFLSPYVVVMKTRPHLLHYAITMLLLFQRPIELGVDLVMHSVTKYLGGHSDIVMGCLSTSNEELHKKLRTIQQYRGATPSAFDCYLLSRSLYTLEVRQNT